MGIREWIGIKQCRVRAESCRTLEDLFLKIKDVPFEAGKPELYRKEHVIGFPALDESNQVQIFGEKGRFTIIRSTIPAMGSVMRNTPEEGAETFRKRKKICMELCQDTADQINAMHL